jgi:hypothetical protein
MYERKINYGDMLNDLDSFNSNLPSKRTGSSSTFNLDSLVDNIDSLIENSPSTSHKSKRPHERVDDQQTIDRRDNYPKDNSKSLHDRSFKRDLDSSDGSSKRNYKSQDYTAQDIYSRRAYDSLDGSSKNDAESHNYSKRTLNESSSRRGGDAQEGSFRSGYDSYESPKRSHVTIPQREHMPVDKSNLYTRSRDTQEKSRTADETSSSGLTRPVPPRQHSSAVSEVLK